MIKQTTLRQESSLKQSSPILYKMSGAGNTFLLAKSDGFFQNVSKKNFSKQVCDSVFGFKADGFLLLEPGNNEADFKWDFYNSDGSPAEMCGNAARCAAKFCNEILEIKQKEFSFLTGAGVIRTEILDNEQIKVQMTEAKTIQELITLKVKEAELEFSLVNTGVPHLVKKIENFSEVNLYKEIAKQARSHQKLESSGANVTFFSIQKEDEIRAVTFERGVEDYTLACGTGAVAAAFVYKKIVDKKEIKVEMPGGVLTVNFFNSEKSPNLIGPAIIIGSVTLNTEDLK